MDDRPEQKPDDAPASDSPDSAASAPEPAVAEPAEPSEARDSAFSSANQSHLPPTGTFPVADFPTEQHLNLPTNALPPLAGHGPDVLASPTPNISGPLFPASPIFPPAVPPNGGFVPPAYAGAPRRHPWEIPLLVVVILATLGIYVGALVLALTGVLNSYLLIVLAVPLILWFGRATLWASPRVQGIQMTPTQFPVGYQMVRDAAARYGLREVPDAFVVLGNGTINAFASGHGFRRFIVVYSDLFEVGGEARDPDALAYIIGHEVGHIAAGHASFWRQFGSFAMSYLPVVGTALSRSQEYTADNYGYFNQPSGSVGGMGLLGAGKYLGRQVDFDQLADRATTDRGFFTWLTNLLATHPVLTWRAAALRNRTKAGSLFFAPSQTVRGVGGGAVTPVAGVPEFSKQEVLVANPVKQELPPGTVGPYPPNPAG